MNDKPNKLERQRQRALAAQENYASSLVKAADVERKRRNGRLIKLGTIAVQFMEAGDTVLLSRFEDAVGRQFASRKVDRLDFGLDESETWFDRLREDQFTKTAKANEQGPTLASSEQRSTPATSSSAGTPLLNGAPKGANAVPARPPSHGASHAPSGSPPSSASA